MVLVETMFYAVLTPLLPYYVEQLGLSKASAGTLSAFYAFGTIGFSVPAGFLVARIGARPTVLAGVVMLSASSVAFGFGKEIGWLDAARFVRGRAGRASGRAGSPGWSPAPRPSAAAS